MARLTILQYPNPLLAKSCKRVEDFTPELHQLLDDMTQTMRESGGIGLAAPQVGILYRVCVLETKGGVLELVNPTIVAQKNFRNGFEACLSVKETTAHNGIVERPHTITLSAQDRFGEPIKLKLRGLEAVCACHELDHLDGKLYIDHPHIELTEDIND